MRFHVGWRGNGAFLTRVWKSLPSRRVLKTVRLTTIRNGPKQTISASSEFEMLRRISESVTEQCETLVGVGLNPFHSRRVLKTVRLMTIRNRQKRTISASGRHELLQMLSESDTR